MPPEMETLEAFKALIRGAGPKAKRSLPSKFVKKQEEIPSLALSPEQPCITALHLAENTLIGKFTGLWPSPKALEAWMLESWKTLKIGPVTKYAVGRGFFVLSFSKKTDRDLVFRYGPYFMGSRGLFLAPWTIDFNPEDEITAAPIWVRLPHLPLHLWEPSTLEDIGNKLGRFLDSAEPKGDQFTCARICVEVNLEKGLPEAIKLTLGDWCHIQELDYEQIPFKCLRCHVYGHFAKNCPQAAEDKEPVKETEFQPATNRRRQSRRKEPLVQTPEATHTAGAILETKNSFEALQEDEVQVPEATTVEEEPSPVKKLSGPPEPVVAADVPEAVDLVEPGTSPSKPVDIEYPPFVVSIDHVGKEATPNAAIPEYEAPVQEGSILAPLCSDSSKGFSETTGYLTRGRKSNRERRENEAAANFSLGSQKKLDPYFKGRH